MYKCCSYILIIQRFKPRTSNSPQTWTWFHQRQEKIKTNKQKKNDVQNKCFTIFHHYHQRLLDLVPCLFTWPWR